MKAVTIVGLLSATLAFTPVAFATPANNACPDAAKAAMDAKFGATIDGVLTSDITQCLSIREEIKVAVNVSGAAINGKNGINQQINNVKNMVDNYEQVYGISQGAGGYNIAVIVHGSAGKFLLDNTAYDSKYADVGGNGPTVAAVNYLLSKGVKFFMCQNTMKSNGFVTADLIPGVAEVPAGVTAVADYGMRRWVVMTP